MIMVISSALFSAAIVLGWCAGVPAADSESRSGLTRLAWLASLVGSVLLIISGARGLAGASASVALPVGGAVGPTGLVLDPLAGLFLVISFGVAAPALLAAALPGSAERLRARPRLAAAVALVLLSTQLIITAGDLFVLLFGWELLGLGFYVTVGHDRTVRLRPRSAVLASTFSKISGAFLLVGGLLLAAGAHSFTLTALGGQHGPRAATAYALLVIGFGIKVGLLPAHIWLPPSYAHAPGAARALLAGAAVNVGFYGMFRLTDVLGKPPIVLVCALLIVAGLTALLGISHAAVHADLTGLIAWSSVENAGLIVTGYGIALVGVSTADLRLTAAGLLAASAQICTHAAAKSLLFVAAGEVEELHRSVDLDRLRGIARRQPMAGLGLTIGSFTLAGLPLTAGFASEWFILEALMQQFRVHRLALQLCLAVAGALVALTVGVAGLAFVRLIGLTVFGGRHAAAADRHQPVEAAVPSSWGVRISIIALSAVCLGLAMVAPLEVDVIGRGLLPVVGHTVAQAHADPLILQPVFSNFSALSPSLLWIVIPGYTLLVALLATAVSGGRLLKVRVVEAWGSGSAGVPGRQGYTSYGFANPIRRVLAALLMTRQELTGHTRNGTNHESGDVGPAELTYRVDVTDPIERFLYRPLLHGFRVVSRVARRLQSGRLDAYLAYMLIALLVMLVVVLV